MTDEQILGPQTRSFSYLGVQAPDALRSLPEGEVRNAIYAVWLDFLEANRLLTQSLAETQAMIGLPPFPWAEREPSTADPALAAAPAATPALDSSSPPASP